MLPLAAAAFLTAAAPSAAQTPAPDPIQLVEEQKAAIAKLAFLDGLWRGTSTQTRPDGQRPVRIADFALTRVADTDFPNAYPNVVPGPARP